MSLYTNAYWLQNSVPPDVDPYWESVAFITEFNQSQPMTPG